MCRIIYKPHCSNCGAIIEDEVAYGYNMLDKLDFTIGTEFWICPKRCKSCGEKFEAIELKPPKYEENN